MMDVPSRYGKAHFSQLFSERNSQLKETISSIYISNAKGTLLSPPFCYPERISKDVAEGIVNNGDKLMSNALAESDDEGEIDELNQMGDDFQAMVSGTVLELSIDNNQQYRGKQEEVYHHYPKPKGFHITKRSATQFSKGLEEIRNYIKMRAYQGFSGAVALLGEHNEDGIVFGGQQTVPLEIIEGQIQNMLAGRGKQLAPMTLDLITLQSNGCLKVSTIRANEDQIDKIILQ